MDELISRKALRDHIYAQFRTAEQVDGLEVGEHLILMTIDQQPTVAAEPVRHGAWVGKHKSTCSECGDVNLRAYVGPTPLYCQVCGARMDLDPAMVEKEDSR